MGFGVAPVGGRTPRWPVPSNHLEDAMTSHAETWKSAAEPFGRTIAAVAGLVMTRIRQIVVAFRHRRDAAVLASLDDRMLADIGLTRSDLREAFSEPLWRDPTALLVNRIGGRRAGRRPTGLPARAFAAPSIVPAVGGARAVGDPARRRL
jgi:uncharacterized protein YjiS (DUF1127 family)